MQMPLSQFGEFLTHRGEFVRIEDTQRYRRARVQLHWRGVVVRDEIEGARIKTKEQQVAHAGELLVAEIDAKVGGIGIVPSELDGAIVSSHYFLFEIDEAKCTRLWLDWFVRSGALADQITARGSTNYAAIRPHHVNGFELPLPHPDEQRRIVSRIERLMDKVKQARALRQQCIMEMESLCRSFLLATGTTTKPTPMHELVRFREPDIVVRATETYHFAGVYCFGGGVFSGRHRAGSEFSYRSLTRLKSGNFVYPKLMAWEGALGVVDEKCDGLVVSPEFPVFEVLEGQVLPETLDVYFKTPSVWPELAAISTGTNVRRRRLHPSAFLNYKMPIPSMKVQEQLRAVKVKKDALEKLQSETSAELDALMPSILSKAFRGEL